jgi:four helix bundle protein
MFNQNPLTMFLQLAHMKMDVYKMSQSLAMECYRITANFPTHEKFAMTQQLRRAVLSVHLNLAEGCSRKSKPERKRFFEISRGSVVEIDACLELAVKLRYVNLEDLKDFGDFIVRTFQMLSRMIDPNSTAQ